MKRLFVLLLAAPLALMAQMVIPPPALTSEITFNYPELKPGAPLHLVAYGDMRFTDPHNTTDTNPRARKFLVDRIAEEHPDALFLTGDMPFHGADPADWKIYEQETVAWRAEHLRTFPCIGNHELVGTLSVHPGLTNYFAAYPQLREHATYSVLLGNVELLSLDSLGDQGTAQPRLAWVAAQLDHIPPQVDFVFVMAHVPIFDDVQSQVIAHLPSPEGLRLRQLLEEKAAKLRPRLIVVSGHIHNYERFYHAGITYLISGGGGAKPYPVYIRGDLDLYRDTAYPVFHYLTLDIKGRELTAKMFKIKDPDPNLKEWTMEQKDSFTLTAPEKAPTASK